MVIKRERGREIEERQVRGCIGVYVKEKNECTAAVVDGGGWFTVMG